MTEFPHLKQWQQLSMAYERRRLGHAYILSGPQNIGKTDFVYRFIQTSICQAPQKYKSCGECSPCRFFLQETFADLCKVRPENNTISVESIRNLESFLTQKSQGDRKWIVIENAHQLNISASSALLKSLEEPINTTFFLVTHHLLTLLPTIRSRCQILAFNGDLLKVDPLAQRQLLDLALGNIDLLCLVEQWQKTDILERLYLIYSTMNDLLVGHFSLIPLEDESKKHLINTMNFKRFWATYDKWCSLKEELGKGIKLNSSLALTSILISWQQIWSE